jgi:Domain of unknown function (DUF4062)
MIEGDLGYGALISESSTFPIDPDVDTIDNCRRRVEENADILVLVIGNRYGSIDVKSGKSITNLEYRAGRAKGIPIFAFVERSAQTLFDAWRKAAPENKPAIAASVEDARLFEFIESVRSVDWTNSFEYAADITKALRAQFAYLMNGGLIAQRAMKIHPDRDVLGTLTPHAYRLAVDQPQYWEYFLFARILDDEVRAASDRRREYDLRLLYGVTDGIGERELFRWIVDRIHEIGALAKNAESLVNAALPDAFGSPGLPASVRDIAFVARQLAKIYVGAIEWTQRVRRARATADDFQAAIDELSTYAADVVDKIGTFGTYMTEQINATLEDMEANPKPPGSAPRVLSLSLRFEFTNPTGVEDAILKVFRARGIEVSTSEP